MYNLWLFCSLFLLRGFGRFVVIRCRCNSDDIFFSPAGPQASKKCLISIVNNAWVPVKYFSSTTSCCQQHGIIHWGPIATSISNFTRLGTDHFTALEWEQNEFYVCGWFPYRFVIVKARQRWHYNICFPGIWFSARVDATEAAQTLRSIESERVFGWYSRRERVKRVCQPLHGRWPPWAFISETWEEAENGGPGVLCADKLFPQFSRSPPTLHPPYLHLIPSLSLSFVCLL